MPDPRGHGRSPRGRYSLQDWADDLVESVPANADLVLGHSLGATALRLVAERLRPRRAVYAEPGLEHDVKPPEHFGQRRRQLGNTTVDSFRAAHPRWNAEDAEAVAAATVRFDPAVLDAVAALSRDGVSLVPERAVVPSLLVVSGTGSVVRLRTAEPLVQCVFSVTVVDNAGQDVHLDSPDRFLAALTGWL